MRTYLSIPFAEKEEAKKYGARWDPNEKLWYSPNGGKDLTDRWPLNEVIKELVGEDRNYGGNALFVDLIPTSCWFTNVRKCIDPSDWDRLRYFIYKRANYQCECCQSKAPLDAHERWHFDEESMTQKLMRIIALCKPCHETTHMGLAQIKGRGDIAIQHLISVNGISEFEAKNHVKKSFDLWGKRNRFKWELDLTIITNSRIKLSQEFNSYERKIFSDNQTRLTRQIEKNSALHLNKNSTISINEISIGEVKDLINNSFDIKESNMKNSSSLSQQNNSKAAAKTQPDHRENNWVRRSGTIFKKTIEYIAKIFYKIV